MSEATATTPSTVSTKYGCLFRLLLLAGLYLFLEGGSFIGLAILEKGWPSLSELNAKRARIGARDTHDPQESEALTAVAHPFVGYVLNRDAGSPLIDYPVSEYGFADSTPPFYRHSPDRLIVAITGGSVAFQLSTTGLSVLERKLATATPFVGREIVFVHLAIGGVRQPQQLMMLQYLLALGAEFDIIINLDGFNDVAIFPSMNLQQQLFHAYPVHWPGLLQGKPSPESKLLLGKVSLYRSLRRRWANGHFATGRSMALSLIWSLGDHALYRFERNARVALTMTVDSDLPYQMTGPSKTYGSEQEMFEDLAALWLRSSLQMGLISRANGIQYFHFLQPNQYAPTSKPMGPAERRVAILEDHPFHVGARQGYPHLIREGEKLKAAGIRYRDLTPLFSDTTEVVYRDSCCHFNVRGCEIIAATIAETIIEAQESTGNQ